MKFRTRIAAGAVSPSMASRAVRRLVPLVAGTSLLLGAASVPSVATTADRTVRTGQTASAGVTAQASLTAQQAAVNPLAGRPWGVYKGLADASWAPYANATGVNRALLAKIALRPKATWFGAWISNADIATRVRQHISVSQAGNPNALVQISVTQGCPVLDQRDPVGGFGNLPCRDVVDAVRQADSNLVEIDRLRKLRHDRPPDQSMPTFATRHIRRVPNVLF